MRPESHAAACRRRYCNVVGCPNYGLEPIDSRPPWMETGGHDRCGPIGQGFTMPLCIRHVRAWHLREALAHKIRIAEEPSHHYANHWRKWMQDSIAVAALFKERWQAGWSYHDPIAHILEARAPMAHWLTAREHVESQRRHERFLDEEREWKSCKRCLCFRREFGGPCRCVQLVAVP